MISPFTGFRIQGWQGVDGVVTTTGVVGDVSIPLGTSTVANATSSLNLVGNLDSSSTVDGDGTTAFSGTLYAGGAVADATTLLTALEDDLLGTNSLDL